MWTVIFFKFPNYYASNGIIQDAKQTDIKATTYIRHYQD